MANEDFTLELIDRMSGPAREMVRELNALRKALKATEGSTERATKAQRDQARAMKEQQRAAKETARVQAREAKKAARIQEQEAMRAARAQKRAAEESRRNLTELRNFVLGDLIASGIRASARAVVGIGRSVTNLTGEVIQMGIFSDKISKSFELIAGSAEGGALAMDRSIELSKELGIGFQEAAVSMRQLMAQSFSMEEASGLIRMVSDLRVLGVEGERTERVLLALTQIRSKGKLQAEEMLQLAEAGVPLAKVREELQKLMNVDSDELERLQLKGLVDPDNALQAVRAAVNSTLGISRSGEAGVKHVQESIQGSIDAAKSSWELFLKGVSDRSGPAFDSMAPAINRIGRALIKEETINAVSEGFQKIIDIAGDSQTIDLLVDSIKAAGYAFRDVGDIIKAFGGGFLDEFAPDMAEAMGDLEKPMSPETIASWKSLGKTFGELSSSVLGLVQNIEKLFGWVLKLHGAYKDVSQTMKDLVPSFDGVGTSLVEMIPGMGTFAKAKRQIGEAIGSIADPKAFEEQRQERQEKARQVGDDMVAGIKQGILNAKEGLMAAVRGLANETVAEFSGPQGIDAHSPSKKFVLRGEYIDLGLAKGIRESGEAARASIDMASDIFSSFMPSRNQTGNFSNSPAARGAVSNNTTNVNLGGVSANTAVYPESGSEVAGITASQLNAAVMSALARSKAAA